MTRETARAAMETGWAPQPWLVSPRMARYLASAADALRIAFGQLPVGTFSARSHRV